MMEKEKDNILRAQRTAEKINKTLIKLGCKPLKEGHKTGCLITFSNKSNQESIKE